MKIRTGFVSNSSSSSFIIIGYKINDAEYFVKKLYPTEYAAAVNKAEAKASEGKYSVDDYLQDYVFDILYNNSHSDEFLGTVMGNGEYFLGHILATSHDYDVLSDGSLNGKQLVEIMEKVKEKTEMEEEPSLIFGTVSC